MKRFFTTISIWLLLFAGVIWFTQCATRSDTCKNVPEGQTSVICTLAGKMGTTPENISMTLQVVNMASLEKNLYTAQEANKFVDVVIADLEKVKASKGKIVVSYLDAVNYVNAKYKLLSSATQAAFIIIAPSALTEQEIKIPLSEYDIDLLLKHLAKQKILISVYIK